VLNFVDINSKKKAMIKKMNVALLLLVLLTLSCSSDDNNVDSDDLVLNLNGLEALGDDFVYEGWIIVDGSPISTGTFSSVTFPQSFSVNADQLRTATTFVLSIEPAVDPDPAPADTKLLVGDFNGDMATVNSANLVGDFSTATGRYILATPTDTDDMNEESGVWFLDNSGGSAVSGLDLPDLSDGWKYEGWAVINGMPISTGTFINVNGFDDNAMSSPFKGDAGDGPAFPGEDFLQNAPAGLSFPTDLRGSTIVISVEPNPDNSVLPFTLKPLAHMVPTNAVTHTTIMMNSGPVVSLSGTVSR